MKVQHHLTRGFWEHEPPPTSLTLGCKRLRPFAPNAAAAASADSFDLKSFIKSPRQHGSTDSQKNNQQPAPPPQHQQRGEAGTATRWNPTQEQIGILEALYRGGMRTPNAQQIENITAHLAKYGKIEGKNVFYWFQNHKARERQKQKRYSNALPPQSRASYANSPLTATASCELALSSAKGDEVENEGKNEAHLCKRKCRSWGDELGEDRTLKLFPLHPEGRSS